MKKCYCGLILLYLALGVNFTFAQQKQSTADSIKSWLYYLASDEMKGRANGSQEIEKVAQWLSAKYKQYGLQPVKGQENFIQPYLLYGDSSFTHKNIIGYIPAKNEKDNDSSFIVLSAHFDHIGTDYPSSEGDSVYNGADDDASGVVTMLGIAKNLYESKLHSDCPIVFVAFSNEEEGRVGSKYFCRSGIVPMQKIKVNINFEMLGRTDEFGKKKYYVTGPGYSNFYELVADFNKNEEWQMSDAGAMVDRLFTMADNFSFFEYARRLQLCVPAHTIATSVGFDYVHQLYDEVKYVDFDNMGALVDNLTQLVVYIAGKNVEVKCK